jgi:hypothetical protein
MESANEQPIELTAQVKADEEESGVLWLFVRRQQMRNTIVDGIRAAEAKQRLELQLGDQQHNDELDALLDAQLSDHRSHVRELG